MPRDKQYWRDYRQTRKAMGRPIPNYKAMRVCQHQVKDGICTLCGKRFAQ